MNRSDPRIRSRSFSLLRWLRTSANPSRALSPAARAAAASQRGRLVEAMAQVVAEKGYPATTVADVVERAGVSRRTFYEQFADKEACFLAAYDVGLSAVLGRIREAVEVRLHAGWRER